MVKPLKRVFKKQVTLEQDGKKVVYKYQTMAPLRESSRFKYDPDGKLVRALERKNLGTYTFWSTFGNKTWVFSCNINGTLLVNKYNIIRLFEAIEKTEYETFRAKLEGLGLTLIVTNDENIVVEDVDGNLSEVKALRDIQADILNAITY
jgi:hypothetical protein